MAVLNNLFKNQKLATQILMRVLSIYLLVAFLVTLVHMYWQFHDTKSFVDKEIEDSFQMVSEGLSKALWEYDDEQIIKTIRGLELLPFISSAVLEDSEGRVYRSDDRVDEAVASHQERNINTYKAPLYLFSNGDRIKDDQVLGYLTVYGDNSDLLSRLELGFWLLIINALIKTVALWFIFMGVGYIMISRPLAALTKAANEVDLKSSTPMLIDIGSPMNNELTLLESTFNEMSARLFSTKSELEYRGSYDSLTGLPNRQLFMDRLSQSIKLANRKENLLAVLCIDLDRFKEINDSSGHQFGDQVLKKVSLILSERIREADTMARIGGDEFIVILNSLEDKNTVIRVIEYINEGINKELLIKEQSIFCTLSIGVAFYPDDASTPEQLLKSADAAMYKAKDDGRNTYSFYSKEMTEKAVQHVFMVNSLRRAIENHEFVVHYQPQVFADSDRIFGMEALVRWNHPELGMIPPDKFIPLAEMTGLIIPIGEEVFNIATKQIAQWVNETSNIYRVAINLSVKQLQQVDIVSKLTEILDRNKCSPEWVELEVTEGYVMKDPELAIQTLHCFSDLGIQIAVDDFGTGYSSLSYLKRLPINKLKIDRSFVMDLSIDSDANNKAIINSVITLSQSMGLKVIAEGVETLDQKEYLIQNGCNEIQGYLYSKPIPALEMGQLLHAQATT